MQPKSTHRKRMAFFLWIETPRGPVKAFCLLDSGAESSFVQQRWAKQHLPDIDSAVRHVRAINDTTVKSYGARKLHLTVGDTVGELRDQYETVESVDMLDVGITDRSVTTQQKVSRTI